MQKILNSDIFYVGIQNSMLTIFLIIVCKVSTFFSIAQFFHRKSTTLYELLLILQYKTQNRCFQKKREKTLLT